MKTVAIVSQKGGAGKTTLALHIAVAAEAAGYPSAIMDMDAQGTAEAWGTWRSEAPPIVLAAKATTLARRLEQAAQAGAGVAVIDTPPIAEAEARAAVTAADLVLIPCRPNAFDLHAIRSTAGLVSYAGKKAFLVFNGGAAPRPCPLCRHNRACARVWPRGLPRDPARPGGLSPRDRHRPGRPGIRAGRQSRRGSGPVMGMGCQSV